MTMQTTQAQPGEQKKELTVSRIIHAPREQVWHASFDPEMMKQWWGPHGFTAPVVRIDLQQGGTYLIAMFTPEGEESWSTGSILEIDPPKRVVMTDSFADEYGDIVSGTYYGMSPDFPLKSIVTYTLDEEGPDTRLTVSYEDMSMIPDEDFEGMKQGWMEMLEKLDALVSGQSSEGMNAPGTNAPGMNAQGAHAHGMNAPGTQAQGLLDQDIDESC